MQFPNRARRLGLSPMTSRLQTALVLDTTFLLFHRITVHHITADMVMAVTVDTAMVATEVMDATIVAPYIRSGVKQNNTKICQ